MGAYSGVEYQDFLQEHDDEEQPHLEVVPFVARRAGLYGSTFTHMNVSVAASYAYFQINAVVFITQGCGVQGTSWGNCHAC